jgi:general secretion pathway protein G
MKSHNVALRRQLSGFTLIEIMVVVVIIGLLAAIVAPNVIRQLDRATVTRAQTDIRTINSTLKQFRMDHYRYPTEQEGLGILTGVAPAISEIDERKLVEYLDDLPKDPWGAQYLYRYPGEHDEYDIFTYGADGKEGGEDINADIGNWNLND